MVCAPSSSEGVDAGAGAALACYEASLSRHPPSLSPSLDEAAVQVREGDADAVRDAQFPAHR